MLWVGLPLLSDNGYIVTASVEIMVISSQNLLSMRCVLFRGNGGTLKTTQNKQSWTTRRRGLAEFDSACPFVYFSHLLFFVIV